MTSFGVVPTAGSAGCATKSSAQLFQRCTFFHSSSWKAWAISGACNMGLTIQSSAGVVVGYEPAPTTAYRHGPPVWRGLLHLRGVLARLITGTGLGKQASSNGQADSESQRWPGWR